MSHTRLDEVEKARKWHTGLTALPTMEQVVRMAEVYEVSVETLLRMAGFKPLFELSVVEQELVATFRALDSSLRERALAAVKGLGES